DEKVTVRGFAGLARELIASMAGEISGDTLVSHTPAGHCVDMACDKFVLERRDEFTLQVFMSRN
ncbi:MAG: hypothetical protein ACJAXZ_004515, partial [Akkermansiaceae bacterium]